MSGAAKRSVHNLPSLGSDPHESEPLESEARGDVEVTSESTTVEVEGCAAPAVTMTADEEAEHIQKVVARIDADLKEKFKAWDGLPGAERLVAASACPAALEEDRNLQLNKPMRIHKHEYACKASKPTKKKSKASQTRKEGVPKVEEGAEEKAPIVPSMWKSGTTKGKAVSTPCVPAASVLMGISYGARMTRYDLLRPVQSLERTFTSGMQIATRGCTDLPATSNRRYTGGKQLGSGMTPASSDLTSTLTLISPGAPAP